MTLSLGWGIEIDADQKPKAAAASAQTMLTASTLLIPNRVRVVPVPCPQSIRAHGKIEGARGDAAPRRAAYIVRMLAQSEPPTLARVEASRPLRNANPGRRRAARNTPASDGRPPRKPLNFSEKRRFCCAYRSLVNCQRAGRRGKRVSAARTAAGVSARLLVGTDVSADFPVVTEAPAGLGNSIVTVEPSLSTTAERGQMVFKRQPPFSLPSWSRASWFVDRSKKIATRLSWPTTVPRSVSGGASGFAGRGGGGGEAGGEGGADGFGGGGRRDSENSGRSRVADRELSRLFERGLPSAGGNAGPASSALGSSGASRDRATSYACATSSASARALPFSCACDGSPAANAAKGKTKNTIFFTVFCYR
jgi:hypothetical protein